jgi:lysophospholipase L1-like esterase
MSSIDYSYPRDPLPADDTPPAGSEWQNSRTKQIWICVSNSPLNAIWQLRTTERATGAVAPSRRSLAAAPALLPVANKTEYPSIYSDGASASATYRTRHFVLSDVAVGALQLRFSNRIAPVGGEAAPPDTVTFKAAIEYGEATYPVTVLNARTWALAGGAEALSDPVAVRMPAGSSFYVREYVEVDTVGKKWPTANVLLQLAAGEGIFDAVDEVDAVTVPGTAAVAWVGPTAIVAPLSAGRPVVAVLGDSVAAGIGDTPQADTYGVGWLARAFSNDVSLVKIAITGSTAGSWGTLTGSYYRRQHLLNCGATHVVCQLGQNDTLDAGLSVAQIKAKLNLLWDQLYALGLPVIQCTFTPKTSSSDSWATLVNQTVPATNTNRQEINTWVRTLPHAAITDVWDVAAVVEDRTGGSYTGKWRVDGGVWVYTTDTLGQHQSAYAHRMSAAAFRSRALEIAL